MIDKDLSAIKKELARDQRRISRNKILHNKLAICGFVIVTFTLLLAMLAPLFYKSGPYEMVVVERLLKPGESGHFLGTDTFGRDLLSRIAYGARVSLIIGGVVTFLSTLFGMIIGLYASYYKALDNMLMRICDALNSIPAMLLAIALVAVLGSSMKNVIISLSIVYTPSVARITRSAALSVKEQTYIESMKALGSGATRIIWIHIVPNILSPIIVQASFIFAKAIITEAALSFLGVGVPAPTPSWGNILNEGKTAINKAWWMIAYPGGITALAVLGLNMIGDGLRDALDPNTK